VVLSHGQAVELAVALVSPVKSWNAFAASPTVPSIPATVRDYFRVIAETQRRLLSFAPQLSRAMRSLAAIKYLGAISGCADQPLRQIWRLLEREGTRPLRVPPGSEVKLASFDEEPGLLVHRLGSWFFEKYVGTNRQPGQYPWDETERLALTMGFTSGQASTIRELQREAPNHSWELALWCEVGVLDPDQAAFLVELQRQVGWEQEFRDLYNTDGGRMPASK
jgi:hypothetical protein